MIWLEVRYVPVTETLAEGVRYGVTVEVLNASGIEREVFVFRSVDDVFMHPAMAYDMNVYPASKALALGAGDAFYRASVMTVTYPTSASAASAIRSFKARLRILVNQWRATRTEDLGNTEVEVYTAE